MTFTYQRSCRPFLFPYSSETTQTHFIQHNKTSPFTYDSFFFKFIKLFHTFVGFIAQLAEQRKKCVTPFPLREPKNLGDYITTALSAVNTHGLLPVKSVQLPNTPMFKEIFHLLCLRIFGVFFSVIFLKVIFSTLLKSTQPFCQSKNISLKKIMLRSDMSQHIVHHCIVACSFKSISGSFKVPCPDKQFPF